MKTYDLSSGMEKFLKFIIITGVIMNGIIVLFMLFLHIIYLPGAFTLLIREIILLIGTIAFFALASGSNMKIAKISAVVIIGISLFNLVGFYVILAFLK